MGTRLVGVGLLVLIGSAGRADDPAAVVKALGPGVNLGNALEAPTEGAWGLTVKPEYLKAIKAAGFGHVRLPVKWSAHAGTEPPYAIDPGFARRVDGIIDQATALGLGVVLNVHHYDEIHKDPAAHKGRLLGLWKQIAERHKNRPASVLFEVMNEPTNEWKPAAWNELAAEAIRVIRVTNPDRVLIVGPIDWNGFRSLAALKLPDADRRLAVTFHYYEPFEFTHQGASWAAGSDKWLGRTWTGNPDQRKKLDGDFDAVARWAQANGRPIYLGEFGAYSRAPMGSRVAWTRAVREAAERRGFGWAYWEFGSGFGVYDPTAGAWREPLLKALIPGK
jgi:endoglucanase